MAEDTHSETVLTLGKKLAGRLGSEPSDDTLSRWMAHWIAELMHAVGETTGEEHTKRMDECAAAIMKLWAHRNVLPDGTRPFESLEPVIRTLQSLDPEAKRFRYFVSPRPRGEPIKESSSEQWLQRATSADDAARWLVRHCLTKAADQAIEGSEEWVTLAKSVISEEDEDLQVIIRLFDENESSEAQRLRKEFRTEVEQQIAGLRVLISLAQSMIEELSASIADS